MLWLAASILGATVRVSAVRKVIAVGVATAETGAVRVRKVVREEMHPVSLQLRRQQVDVRRVPIAVPSNSEMSPGATATRSSSRFRNTSRLSGCNLL
jgi:hypothetical protein